MKYAMIPINRRYSDNNERIVRRVLISYIEKVDGVYQGTKLIEVDPYFKDPNSSQKYEFTDNEFWLISNAYVDSFTQNSLLNQKRKYEYDAGRLIETAIEFEASTNEEAISKFNSRKEPKDGRN